MLDPYRVLQVQPTAEQEVVNAAFRALALKYHPDRDSSPAAARRMALINEAYQLVRSAAKREAFNRAQLRSAWSAMPGGAAASARQASVPPPPRSASAGTRLEFGRYSGWTLRDLARHDPDYLRWLSRHASGLRYRTEIYSILGRMGATAA
ncbi:MAG TPA: DnaJ domain-containing protein [Candidatus Limnocylindria bacterium]|nr:DnaJ domain-containing protein [Candidatus Limnocylindria bacterium]